MYHRLNLAMFLKKYDCQPLQANYLLFVGDRLRKRLSGPLSTFLVGAELGCVDTCVAALDQPPRT